MADRESGPADLGSGSGPAVTAALKKVKKQKVLLMGKSGSGKSSMRSIIFSNYVARDTRRLGATIDIELSHVKFLGNLTLNLWDCGGQEAFMENYLSQQRAHVFSNVGVLIYVFDIESRDTERDMATYVNILSALVQYSREARVFVLVHKMDLVQPATREALYEAHVARVREKTAEAVAMVRKQKHDTPQEPVQQQQQQQQQQQNQQPQQQAAPTPDVVVSLQPFATSIWDQSLYKAWASIIHDLVPNLALIEEHLASLGRAVDATEMLLFERTSFLVVSRWTSPDGDANPFADRFERMSNILKSWKHTASKYTGTSRNSEQFVVFEYKAGTNFAMFVAKFTTNTYILVCLPPGEARFNAAQLNVAQARSWFKFLDQPVGAAGVMAAGAGQPQGSGAAAAGYSSESAAFGRRLHPSL
ncbi:hypothetical protein P8C59_004923 [Phyllachora maydis]|uniref:GTP-binding protein n=1 Tax=Phyllachora maydis TaxID=1825666 RepID=A0AAD9I3G0_9PEZI|nr:hypothetical protein P8C59_004923 [Phyllachora maydis]